MRDMCGSRGKQSQELVPGAKARIKGEADLPMLHRFIRKLVFEDIYYNDEDKAPAGLN